MPVNMSDTLQGALEQGIKVFIKCPNIEERLRIDRLIKGTIPPEQRGLVNFGLRNPGLDDNLLILESENIT